MPSQSLKDLADLIHELSFRDMTAFSNGLNIVQATTILRGPIKS